MTDQIPPRKSFVKSGDHATIVCPKCNTTKDISVQQFRQRLHMLKVKCPCGYVFKVQLEFRRHYRKTTDIQGTYDLSALAGPGVRAKVIDLSLSGACFELNGNHNLQIGHKGVLVFTLDNRNKTRLLKHIVIRTVAGNRIGCEFVEDRAFEKELGFYLLP